jgi:hypothetical protein
MTEQGSNSGRDTKILADLQDAVARMHVVSQQPRVVVATGNRHDGARAMAWQVLFERSLGPDAPQLLYRGVTAGALMDLLVQGFDSEPTIGKVWAHRRMGDAMTHGPVIAAFRADRLPDDVARALIGILVFEEDGLRLHGVRALVGEVGAR